MKDSVLESNRIMLKMQVFVGTEYFSLEIQFIDLKSIFFYIDKNRVVFF